MSYTTLDQLVGRFGEQLLKDLTDRANPPSGSIDVAVVAQELANTDAVIDGYLAGRYVLPIVGAVPPLLADLALAIAIYKLHPYEPDPKIERDYTNAIASLGKVGTGAIRLPVAGVEPAGSDASGVVTIDRERPLTPENMSGFI